MVWLDLAGEEGGGFYLDIRTIEARRQRGETRFAIAGVVGDGLAEAEILAEIGSEVEVVFVDEWLGEKRSDLLRRLGRDTLAAAITEAVAPMAFCIESFPSLEERPRQRVTGYRAEGHWLPLRPQRYGEQLELPLVVAEAAA